MIQLETERLRLRMWREDDFEPYARMCADPEVMRYLNLTGKPLTPEETWRWLASHVGHWHLRGYGMWAVEEKASGQMIGRIGFNNPHGWPGFELGWMLARECWGKGFATEGARQALLHGFTDMNRDHIISVIHPENMASIKVAECLGEKFEKETQLQGMRLLIYGISRDEWQRLNAKC